MQINIYQKNIKLNERQKDYIMGKLEALSRFIILEDPSVLAKVEIEYHDSKISDQDIKIAVNLVIPKQDLFAESFCKTVEEGADLVEEKLRSQLEKLKK